MEARWSWRCSLTWTVLRQRSFIGGGRWKPIRERLQRLRAVALIFTRWRRRWRSSPCWGRCRSTDVRPSRGCADRVDLRELTAAARPMAAAADGEEVLSPRRTPYRRSCASVATRTLMRRAPRSRGWTSWLTCVDACSPAVAPIVIDMPLPRRSCCSARPSAAVRGGAGLRRADPPGCVASERAQPDGHGPPVCVPGRSHAAEGDPWA